MTDNIESNVTWISVKDYLPENREIVITLTKDGRVGTSNCLKSYVETYGNYDRITHWIPFPNKKD